MKSSGQVDMLSAAQSQPGSSAGFSLGVAGAGSSPSRKTASRVRTSSAPSKIPQRPTGAAGSSSQAAVPDAKQPAWNVASNPSSTATQGAQPATSGVPPHQFPERPQSTGPLAFGVAPAASGVSTAGLTAVPPTAQAPMAQPGAPVPTFAVGAVDHQAGGLRTPRGGRLRANKHKASTTSPLPVGASTPFSPLGLGGLEAMTPIEANTYMKLVSKPGSLGGPDAESPMDITPQGSTVSAASNVFVFSPLAGVSFGGQAASCAMGAGGAGLASSASSAPTPSQGFAATVSVAAAAAGPTVPIGAPVAAAGAPAQGAPGIGSRSSSNGGGSGSSSLRFPIQIQIPGAREVQDMFTSAAFATTSGAPGAVNGGKAGAAPAGPSAAGGSLQPTGTAAVAAGVGASQQGLQAGKMAAAVSWGAAKRHPETDVQGSKMVAAVAMAAAKKLPEADAQVTGTAAKDGPASGAGGGAASQAGNDCQPPKDNAPKAARISVDPGSSSAAASRSATPPAPPTAAFPAATAGTSSAASSQHASVSATAVASAAAALGVAAANTAATASAEFGNLGPHFLLAVADQLENMARRTREAAGAASAAQASFGATNPAVAVEAAVASLASESNPALRSVVEIMLRPGSIDAKVAAAAAAARVSASDSAPGLAAAVACMLGALKLDDLRGAGPAPEMAASGTAGANAADSGAGSDKSRGSSAGGISSVPFVFGGASNGGSATAGSNQGGTVPAPTPAAPSAAPVLRFSATAAFGTAPAAPSTAPSAATYQAPPPKQQQPAAVPFVFGAPSPSGQGGPQATAPAAGATAAPSAPASCETTASGLSNSASQGPQAERPSSIGSSTSLPFMFTASTPQPVAAHHTSLASFLSASSPMSTTPASANQQPQQQPQQQQRQPTAPAPSSDWAGGATAAASGAPAGGETFTFTVGDAAAGPAGTTPVRVGGRTRAKVTPRKTRTGASVETGGAPRPNVSGGGASTAAAAAPTSTSSAAAPPPSAPAAGSFGRPSVNTSSGSGAAAQQQQQTSQGQGSSVASESGRDNAMQAARLRQDAEEKKQYGNQKYEASDFRSAERWYSEAIELLEQQLPRLFPTQDKLQQMFPNYKTEVAVLHSNRSGARLMITKPHSALSDALRAMELDPKFMRAASRAATCHCRLGDFAAAHRIIDAAMDRCSASSSHYQDLLKKLNEVVDLGSRARAATAAAVSAVSSGSREKLQEAADKLASIRDQVGFCDVVAAARAVLALRLGFPQEVLTLVAPHPEVPVPQRAAPWRLWLTVQAHYYKGDLQEALVTCKELQLALEAKGAQDATGSDGVSGSSSSQDQEVQAAAGAAAYTTSAPVTVPPPAVLGELGDSLRQLLKLKEDGNAAHNQKRHAEAAEHYSRALSLGCCPAYAAVLHANRAAAHAGQGAIADAVADCGRARALDPSYYKAISRLAAYMLELRRPEDAQGLLEPLVKLGSHSNGTGPRPEELSLIKERLSEARAAVAWQKTPHHYKLLGLANTCSEEDVKKAYRRLALKHHPDKALAAVKVLLVMPGRAGGLPYSGPLVCSTELDTRVREEAAWLFNFINQAHEELSDKARRRKVDQLLEAEQPPHSGRYGGASSSQYGGGWYNGGSSRYGGFSNFHGMDPFFFHRPGGAGPAGGGGGAGGAGGSSRTRTATGGGAGASGSGYGGYGYASYGGGRPASARQASAANGANGNNGARGGAHAGASRNGNGAAGGGGAAAGGYSGYSRAPGGAGAGTRPTAGGRKWWEGGTEYSDDDDEDTFNF